MTDREIETLYWGTAQLFSPMANHAAVIVKFARMIEQAAIKIEREACAKECDEMPQRLGIHCARAIRARSEDREGS